MLENSYFVFRRLRNKKKRVVRSLWAVARRLPASHSLVKKSLQTFKRTYFRSQKKFK
jgi:hypothetical protein